MDKTLGQEYAPEQRVRFLKDNCDKIETIGYMKRFSTDEMSSRKDELAELSIEINEIEAERKFQAQIFKDRMKPLDERKAELLKEIKSKAEFKSEACYKFIDHAEKEVGYYNDEGDLVECRPARPDEAQITLKMITGTND